MAASTLDNTPAKATRRAAILFLNDSAQTLNSINRLEGASLRAVARWAEARGRPYWLGHVTVVYVRSALILTYLCFYLSCYLVLVRRRNGKTL